MSNQRINLKLLYTETKLLKFILPSKIHKGVSRMTLWPFLLIMKQMKVEATSWRPPTACVSSSCTSRAARCRACMWVGKSWYYSYFPAAALHQAAAVCTHRELNGRWPCLITTAGVPVTITESLQPHKGPSACPRPIFSPNYNNTNEENIFKRSDQELVLLLIMLEAIF